jgi:hypothetical protein
LDDAKRRLPTWIELLGVENARRFSSVRRLSLVAAASPILVVIGIIIAAATNSNIAFGAMIAAVISIALIVVACVRIQGFGVFLAAQLSAQLEKTVNPPFIRNKGALLVWASANGLSLTEVASAGNE